jgi:flagellar hook-length control protein FliK
MTTQKVQSAEIRLDPKELGAVDVKIRIHQDQATVVFSSPHAQVRDALENSIPRLREMFAESGLGLGNVNVNDRGGSSAGSNEQSQGQGGNGGYGAGEEIAEERQQRLPRQPNGLVDFYA